MVQCAVNNDACVGTLSLAEVVRIESAFMCLCMCKPQGSNRMFWAWRFGPWADVNCKSCLVTHRGGVIHYIGVH